MADLNWVHPKEQYKLIFEYYDRVSKPKDSDVLGDWEVWVYGNDRSEFPPHCHVRLPNGSVEFEVSLLNWSIVNIKNSDLLNSWDSIDQDIRKGFFKWLDRDSKENPKLTNKQFLYAFWNGANPNNLLEKWIDKKDNIDKDLLEYLNPTIDYKRLSKDVIALLSEIYFTDIDRRKEIHSLSLQEILNYLDIDLDISEDETAQEVVRQAESNVYLWSTK